MLFKKLKKYLKYLNNKYKMTSSNLTLKLSSDCIFYSDQDQLLTSMSNLSVFEKTDSNDTEINHTNHVIVKTYYTINKTMNINGRYYLRIFNPEESYVDCEIISKKTDLKFSEFSGKPIFIIRYKKWSEDVWIIDARI